MARLMISLLGSFRVNIDGTAITQFESNKVRGLLAYLVVESLQNHRREKLAALFWPDMTTQDARSNLSRALYNFRGLIQDHQAEPPYLLRSRDSIQFNPGSDYWLDIDTIREQFGGRTIVIVDATAENLSSMNDPTRWTLLGDRRLLINTLMGAR